MTEILTTLLENSVMMETLSVVMAALIHANLKNVEMVLKTTAPIKSVMMEIPSIMMDAQNVN